MKINITIKPNSKKGPAVEQGDDRLIVYSRKPAVDGLANEDLIKILSEYFNVPKTSIKIVRGATSRNKTIEIT
jgi:uncharacterized protein (TIGR00251 family)